MSYVHTYIHTYIRTYVHTCIHTFTHTYVRTFTHTYIRRYVRTYIHSHIHTYVHTYISSLYLADTDTLSSYTLTPVFKPATNNGTSESFIQDFFVGGGDAAMQGGMGISPQNPNIPLQIFQTINFIYSAKSSFKTRFFQLI